MSTKPKIKRKIIQYDLNMNIIIAERVTFLSSGKKHVDEKSFDENDEVKDKEKPKKSSKKSE